MSPRRVYLLTHPFIFMFGIGIFLAGLELSTFAFDPQLVVLPEWLRFLWHATYTIGGLSLALGIVRRNPALEGVGLNLVGGAFIAQTLLSLRGGPLSLTAPGATFLFVLALGMFLRFAILLKYMARGKPLPSDLLVAIANGGENDRNRKRR